MKYEALLPISRHQLEQALRGGAPEEAAQAILRMALNDPDWHWAEQKCIAALHDDRDELRAAAITSLGHLARIHHAITNELVVLTQNPKTRQLES